MVSLVCCIVWLCHSQDLSFNFSNIYINDFGSDCFSSCRCYSYYFAGGFIMALGSHGPGGWFKTFTFSEAKKDEQPHTYERRRCHVKGGLLAILCLVVSYCKTLSLLYRIIVESASDCMTRWTRHLNDWPTRIKEKCIHLFRTYSSLGNT